MRLHQELILFQSAGVGRSSGKVPQNRCWHGSSYAGFPRCLSGKRPVTFSDSLWAASSRSRCARPDQREGCGTSLPGNDRKSCRALTLRIVQSLINWVCEFPLSPSLLSQSRTSVSHVVGDHTPMLALIEKRFLTTASGARQHLTLRDEFAHTLEHMFDFSRSPSLNSVLTEALPPLNDCTPPYRTRTNDTVAHARRFRDWLEFLSLPAAIRRSGILDWIEARKEKISAGRRNPLFLRF
jgi:hypothetical protein